MNKVQQNQQKAKEYIISKLYGVGGDFHFVEGGSEYGYTFQFDAIPEEMMEEFNIALGGKIKSNILMSQCWQVTKAKYPNDCKSRPQIGLAYFTKQEVLDYFIKTFKEKLIAL